MARNRTPLAVARVTGATLQHPERYVGRSNPVAVPLGEPPDTLNADQQEVWRELAGDMPWLVNSDRHILDLTCRLSVAVSEPGCPMGVYTQLRLCLASLGGTPVDRCKVKVSGDDADDPTDEFVN